MVLLVRVETAAEKSGRLSIGRERAAVFPANAVSVVKPTGLVVTCAETNDVANRSAAITAAKDRRMGFPFGVSRIVGKYGAV